MMINFIFVSTIILQSTFAWDRSVLRDSGIFRNSIITKPKNDNFKKSKNFQRIPRVPFSNRGQEHNDARDWHFDQSRSRAAGDRFDSEKLINGIPYGKSGYARSATLFDIEISETGVNFLNIMTNGGSGDVDIYVKRDDYPTKSNYDVRSAHPGNQEQIIIETPVPGKYYIVLYGYESYNLIGFEAEYR